MTINFIFASVGNATISAVAQDVTFEAPPDCKTWAKRASEAALNAVRSIPFQRDAMHTISSEEFEKSFGVRQCPRCCGTCRHGRDMCNDGCYRCKHPTLKEDDVLYTSADSVCSAWEQ
jgi:hypothetical protein